MTETPSPYDPGSKPPIAVPTSAEVRHAVRERLTSVENELADAKREVASLKSELADLRRELNENREQPDHPEKCASL